MDFLDFPSGGTRYCMEKLTLRKKYKAEFDAYRHMKSRCHYKNNEKFHRYGARNISICERWLESFENFFEDMGPRPSPAHSIDRKDNNGNYEPGNCRWATDQEQSRNRITCRMICYKGKTQCISAWAEEFGMKRDDFRYRLKKGLSMEEIEKCTIIEHF